jgi:hypothetical protein
MSPQWLLFADPAGDQIRKEYMDAVAASKN